MYGDSIETLSSHGHFKKYIFCGSCFHATMVKMLFLCKCGQHSTLHANISIFHVGGSDADCGVGGSH